MFVAAFSQHFNSLRSSLVLQWVIFRLPSIQTQLAIGTAHEVVALFGGSKMPASFHHLVCLAYPSSLGFMRPPNGECNSSRVCKPCARRIFHLVGVVLLGLRMAHHDRPATFW